MISSSRIESPFTMVEADRRGIRADLVRNDWSAFWQALHGQPAPERVMAVVEEFLVGWGQRTIEDRPAWLSHVSDDGTPWELSMAWDKRGIETRLLVEAQGQAPTWASTVAAGLELTARLARHGAHVELLDGLHDLFLPSGGNGTFGLWNAVAFPHAGEPLFKVYLNPQIHGLYQAHSVVEEAFARLGLRSAWPIVAEASRRGDDIDEIRYFSLDLDSSTTARVKVYLAHEGVTAAELERVFALAPDGRPGRITALCEAVGGGSGPFTSLPVSTCLSFVAGSDRPTVTAHLPVRAYATNDAEGLARISGWLGSAGHDSAVYRAAVAAITHRSLDAGVGLQTYASIKAGPDPRCTVYLACEARKVALPRIPVDPPPNPDPPVTGLVAWGHRIDFGKHPFFRRLEQSEHVVDPLYRLALNMRAGIAHRFTPWLATLIGRVPDVHVRSILAHQLDDELGHGNGDNAHVFLFEQMFAAVEAKASPIPEGMDVLAPARRFNAVIEPLFTAGNPWVGVGMAALAEVAASQTDEVIARVFRGQQTVDHAKLQWAFVHDELEKDHAEDSDSIMARVGSDPERCKAVWHGARQGVLALWTLLDDLYPLCFA